MKRVVIVLITAAVLGGCAPPPPATGDHTVATSDPRAACFKNLRAIDRATEISGMANNLKVGESPSPEMFSGYLASESGSTNCPSGGTYSFGIIGTKPECSIHGTLSQQWKHDKE
jgi:hypothetical protein